MSYRQTIDAFALGQLLRLPQIPDYHLMVGSAEQLNGLPVMVYTSTAVPTAIAGEWGKYQDKSSEEIEKKIADNSLEVNDMNWNLAMLGGGLGGEIL